MGEMSFEILTITALLAVQTLQIEIKGNIVWKGCNVGVEEFRLLSQVSFAECVKSCNVRSKCSSVKYQHRYNICQLYTTDVTADANVLFTDGAWQGTCAYVGVHRDNRSDTQPGSFSCANCSKDQVCDEQQEVCSFQECGDILAPNATFLGNQNYVGARKRIVCEAGTSEVNNEQFVQCDSSGQWNYTPSCLPQPPQTTSTQPPQTSVTTTTTSTTASTSTTLVYNGSLISCPKLALEWLTANAYPAISFAFVKNAITFSEAKAACLAQNSTLVKINETWKQETIQHVPGTCSGYHQNFWIDGVKTQLGTEWRFSDNSSVPDFNFWMNGVSGTSGDGHNCIRINADGLWESNDCMNIQNYICEKHI